MQLTKHFTLAELTVSQTASRLGINNAPDLTQIDNLRELCREVLEKCRVHYGRSITPSSGFRSEELNQAIGGSPSSQHCKGEAVDFKVPGVPNMLLAEWIRDNCDYDQLILEYPRKDDPYAGWVHVSFNRRAPNRREVLTATRAGYVKGLVV